MKLEPKLRSAVLKHKSNKYAQNVFMSNRATQKREVTDQKIADTLNNHLEG